MAEEWSWPHTYTQFINKIINKFKHSYYKRWNHVSFELRFSLSSRTTLQAQLAEYGLGGLQSPSKHIDGHDRQGTCNVTSWRVRVTVELEQCWPTNVPFNNVMIVAIVAMEAQRYVSVLLHYVCHCQHHDRHVSLRVTWLIFFVLFLVKSEVSQQRFVIVTDIKFHEIPSSGRGADTCA